MSKSKLAFVVHRYGKDVNGGAEYTSRVLAQHLSELYEMEILTTCARANDPWDNFYPAGTELIDNIRIKRFPVEKTGEEEIDMAVIERQMESGDEKASEEWMKGVGPYCPKLIKYIAENAAKYKNIVFFTYAVYPTVMGLKLGLKNTILVPTAHDEPIIYKRVYQSVFQLPQGYFYNSIEEREFIFERFHTEEKKSCLTCVGIDVNQVAENSKEYVQYDNYVVYVGRVCRGKNFPQLNKYFMEYKRRNPSDLKLLVLGKMENGLEIVCHDDIKFLGFVSDKEKFSIMKNARLLCMPSKHESLSWVLLESMALGRPVVVNEKCKVLKGQCIRSNAGLYYSNYMEYELCMNFLLDIKNISIYEEMGENGRRFVEENYNWDRVIENVCSCIEEVNKDVI